MVSIVVTAYNVERFIEQALRSCLSQEIDDIECIVVEDCSTDNTAAIIDQIAKKDQRCRVIRNSTNIGAGASRRKASMPHVANTFFYSTATIGWKVIL